MWLWFMLIYLVFINIIGIVAMYVDKRKAARKQWRMKEKTLFSIAWLGGSGGILIGSKRFRHKTNHKRFKYGIPIIMLIQVTLLLVLYSIFT